MWSAASRVDLGTPKQRTVLAMLAMRPGRMVDLTELIDEIWPEGPPRSAVPNVRTYAANLRRAFEAHDSGRGVLVRQGNGYRLDVPAAAVDLFRFLDDVEQARVLLSRGEVEPARSRLSEAMSRWLGPPLVGMPLGPSLTAQVAAAQEQYLLAVELLADIDIKAGWVDEAIPLLRRAVAAHPLRESAVLLLMRALAQRGDLTGGISVYRAAARAMQEELGVEPIVELRRLYQAMMERESGPAGREPVPEIARPVPPEPASPGLAGRQWDWLPRPVADFVGRVDIVERLVAKSRSGDGSEPRVHLIDGMAGSGKTTLAARVARRLVSAYPDGQLFIDLRGHEDGNLVPPATALVALLRQLGVPAGRIPIDLEERRGLWRRELSARRVVVVLDNAYDSAQVIPLLPVTSSSVVIVTSRRRLVDLDVGPPESLSVLSAEEGLRLLAATAGPGRVQAEPEAAAEIVRRCGNLPLAIRMVGSRLAHRPSRRLADLAARLAVEESGLATFATGDQSVASAFGASYEPLNDVTKRVFRLLGLHAGHYDVGMVAAMAGLTHAETGRILDDLVDCHLLEESENRRYRMHDLVRQFARERCVEVDSAQVRQDALVSLLNHVLHICIQAAEPLNRLLEVREDVGVTAPERPDLVTASGVLDVDWLERERSNLNLLVELAAAHGLHAYTWRMARVLWRFFFVRGYFEDILRTHELGLVAAERSGDRLAMCIMNNYLASALTKTGSYRRAIDCLNAALAIAQESSNLFETAKIRGNLSVVYWSKGEFEEAAKLGTEALRELPMRYAHRFVIYLPNLGLALTSLGRYAEALRAHRLHLYWANVRGDRYQIANALSHIAGVRVRLGDHRQAVRLLRSAMILFARTGHRYGETDARNTLGIAYRELGLPAQARRQHELALELAGDSAERHAECGVLNDLAHTLAAGGDTEGAIRAHRRAFDLATRIDNRYEQARALAGLAERLLTTDPAEARRHWERALAMFRAMGAPERHEVEHRLADTGPGQAHLSISYRHRR
ncbi:AfsR/SARP family transcriptional regulator [Micromonospora endophytica]|uniref:AfsR/SARP family transcriptional regulator n=1 Tax=Micromonospora endophytica TaxID=515350 RepID=UPI001CB92D6B|nr:BTAD domain-containing putative transcriptional regulator [Micromonospora endophytica]